MLKVAKSKFGCPIGKKNRRLTKSYTSLKIQIPETMSLVDDNHVHVLLRASLFQILLKYFVKPRK
uniref:Putative ovule protein n=1 Tax=Solanum chacoense TaxID=4108 RepID=A0A0V0HQY9_SOLCH